MRSSTVPWKRSSTVMSFIRARIRSSDTRPSTRASGAPGQECTPRAKAICSRTFLRSSRNSCGHSNRSGSRLAAAAEIITIVPAGMSTPARLVDLTRQAEFGLDGALHAQRLLDEDRDQAGVVAQRLLQFRTIAQDAQGGAEQLGRRLLARTEQEAGGAHDIGDGGHRPVRVGGRSQFAQHVVAWFRAALFDVGTELLVEELQRVDRRCIALDVPHQVRARQCITELFVVSLGNAEQVGDCQQRERFRVRGEELAFAAVDELVELAVGELPEEVLVGLEPARGEQPGQQGTRPRVVGRIHRHHVLVQRHLGAVRIDLSIADVIALGCERQRRERTSHGHTVRPQVGVLEHLERLAVRRHRHHAVVRLPSRPAPGRAGIRSTAVDRARTPGW